MTDHSTRLDELISILMERLAATSPGWTLGSYSSSSGSSYEGTLCFSLEADPDFKVRVDLTVKREPIEREPIDLAMIEDRP
jgi:hypothetical protein